MLATFTHAINNNSATAAPSVKSVFLNGPTDAIRVAAHLNGKALRVILGMVCGPALRDGQQIRLGLLQGHARLQSRLKDEPPLVVRGIQLGRLPEVRPALGESLGHDADQRCRLAVQHKRAAQDRRVQMETPLPHFVAHYENGGGGGLGVLGRNDAPEQRRHAQEFERVPSDVCAVELLRAFACCPEDVAVAAADIFAEHMVLSAEFQVLRGFQGLPPSRPRIVEIVDVECRDAVRVAIGKRRQQYVLDHAEHGGGSADAQRESDHRERREAGVRAHPAQAVTHVLPEGQHGYKTDLVAEMFRCSATLLRKGIA
jgi:hypothetical protein